MITKTSRFHFISRMSRKGKIVLPLMSCILCVEAAWAYRQITGYLTNPCTTEAAGLFVTADGGCKDVRS